MKKFYLFLILIILSIFNFNFIYGQSYISQINFVDNEFIEIYSDDFLNFSDFTLYDESGPNKANTLENLKLVNNSKYFLIVSTDYILNNNISNLNCSIYTNKKSQLGYYGLKNSGENFTLFSNITNINLTFIKEKDLNFQNNETLNYDLNTQNFIISQKNLCLDFIYLENNVSTNITNNTNFQLNETLNNDSEIIDNNSNLSFNQFQNTTKQSELNLTIININNTTNINNTNICDYSFDILTSKEIFIDKLTYKFKTNATNTFTIEYWIEDYGSNIVKNKLNSSSLTEKSFTPKFSEILNIKANLITENNCVLNTSKYVYFYSENKNLKENSSTQSINSNINSNISQNSYIKILNKEAIQNLSSNILEYEIYRGNTLKRTIYIYYNSKKLSSFELEKYSKLSGKINLNEFFKNNSIIISGLDQEDSLIFYPPEINFSLNNTILASNKDKEQFEIVNFSLNEDKISFKINSNFNYDALCYVNYDKTLISNTLETNNTNLSQANFLFLNLNDSKINEKLKEKIADLKFYCKYKKSELKTYKSFTFNFTYNNSNSTFILKNNLNLSKNLIDVNNNYLKFNENNLTNNKEDIFSIIEIKNYSTILEKNNFSNLNKSNQSYYSLNYIMKEKSYFSIFIGSITILGTLITIW